MQRQSWAAEESYMKAFSKVMAVALCTVLALAAVSCADNSKGGKNDLSGSNVFVSSTTEYRYTTTSDDKKTTTRVSIFFTSEKDFRHEQAITTDGTTVTGSTKGTYTVSGDTVKFSYKNSNGTETSTEEGTFSNNRKTLTIDGTAFTKQ